MSAWKKIAYAIGNLGASVSYQAVSTYVQFFYLDVMRLTPARMALAMTIFAIWNSLNDPLAGALSDRTRTRWGRRIPYILFGTLPVAIFFVLLWRVPAVFAQDQTALFLYLVTLLFLFDALHTVVSLNYAALFPEMFTTLAARAQMSSWRQVFGVIGTAWGIALPPVLYVTFGWGAFGFFIGIVTAVTLYISLLGSHERASEMNQDAMPWRAALRATFRNRSFAAYMGMQVMLQFAFLLIMATIPFYAKYVLQATEEITSLLLGATLVVAGILLLGWGRIAARWGARTTMLAALGAFGVALIPFLFVETVTGTLLTTAAAGIGLSGILIVPDIMLSDVIDEDALKTGKRREGMYYGIQGLLIRAAIVLQALVLNVLLSLGGYDPALNADAQPPALAFGIRLAVSLVPLTAVLLGMGAVTLYPLHGARLKEIRQQQNSAAV
jgi:GPH family glycoside/pentoside/hexuronide:cation symporter